MTKKEKDPAPDPEPQQPDIGSLLAITRKKKALTLEEAARVTRLPKRLLIALEENRPGEFPALVYYRGSLESYCIFLDLDFESLWREMGPDPAAPAAPAPAPGGEEAASHWGSPSSDGGAGLPRVAQPLLIPIGIFALLLAAAALVRLTTQSSSQKPPARPASPPALLEPVTQARPAAPQGLELRVEPRQDAWVRLRVDKKLVFEGRLPAGTVKTWDAVESFWIRTPTPQRLRVWVSGKEVDLKDFPKDAYDNIVLTPGPESQPQSPAPAAPPAHATPPAP